MNLKSWKEVVVSKEKVKEDSSRWNDFKIFCSKVFYRICLLGLVLIPGLTYVLSFSYVVTSTINYLRRTIYLRALIT